MLRAAEDDVVLAAYQCPIICFRVQPCPYHFTPGHRRPRRSVEHCRVQPHGPSSQGGARINRMLVVKLSWWMYSCGFQFTLNRTFFLLRLCWGVVGAEIDRRRARECAKQQNYHEKTRPPRARAPSLFNSDCESFCRASSVCARERALRGLSRS